MPLRTSIGLLLPLSERNLSTTASFAYLINIKFMKKILCILSSLFLANSLFAQQPADALRNSWTVPGGTARQQAIGGAMGSLGGDISAAFTNPAGLAFYKTGDFVFSPQYRFGKTKSTYMGRQEQEENNKFNWGTTGFVFGSGNGGRKIRNAAFSLAYNRKADFNSSLLYRGVNNKSSFSQQYVEELRANNIRDVPTAARFSPFGASLAFNTYWIDTAQGWNSGNKNFRSLSQAAASTGLIQQQTTVTTGGINEFAFAGGVNLNDKLMLGGTLGVDVLSFVRDATYTEADATDNPNNNFDFASLTENISTKGAGINLRLGLIYKPQEYWRLGLAFHTPTFYNLTDNSEATVTANTEGYQGEWKQTNQDIDDLSGQFKYSLSTPYRAVASISYVLREIEDVTKQRGFLTADVEYVNHKASSYSEYTDEDYSSNGENRAYLKSLNEAIDNAYKGAFNFRVGGELKFTTLMVRAGAAYYGNPYQNINGDKGSKLNLSGGLGYRNKGFFADLTYVHAMNKDVQFPYRLEDTNLYAGANVNATAGNVLLTFGLKF